MQVAIRCSLSSNGHLAFLFPDSGKHLNLYFPTENKETVGLGNRGGYTSQQENGMENSQGQKKMYNATGEKMKDRIVVEPKILWEQ